MEDRRKQADLQQPNKNVIENKNWIETMQEGR